MLSRLLLVTIAVSLAAAGVGCGGQGGGKGSSPPRSIRLESPAFSNGGMLPARVTCDGAGRPPPLRWSGVPRSSTASLAVTVEDPDARGGPFLHWAIYGLARLDVALPGDRVPRGARQATSSSGKHGYAPPCPPKGDRPHHYVFTLYALSRRLRLPDGSPGPSVLSGIRSAAVAQGRLVGRYRRR